MTYDTGFLYGLIFGMKLGWSIGAGMMVSHYRKQRNAK